MKIVNFKEEGNYIDLESKKDRDIIIFIINSITEQLEASANKEDTLSLRDAKYAVLSTLDLEGYGIITNPSKLLLEE